jgi:hypothetical protein
MVAGSWPCKVRASSFAMGAPAGAKENLVAKLMGREYWLFVSVSN